MEQRYRSRRGAQPARTSDTDLDAPPAIAGPLIARFVEEDETGYLVGDPWGSRTARVPKQRALGEPNASGKMGRSASERLLRWSSLALVGVVFGGIVGIALGGIVTLATLVRLARLSGRIRRWRRRQRTSGDQRVLPMEATRERAQLLAALGQSVLAVVLGGAVLYIILVML